MICFFTVYIYIPPFVSYTVREKHMKESRKADVRGGLPLLFPCLDLYGTYCQSFFKMKSMVVIAIDNREMMIATSAGVIFIFLILAFLSYRNSSL